MGGSPMIRLIGMGMVSVVLLAGCTDEETLRISTEERSGAYDAAAVANGAASSIGVSSLDSLTAEGLGLEVEYFEALRKGDWVAPRNCWFSTRLDIGGMLGSQGFNGPRSDDDREAGEGVLVGTLAAPTPLSAPAPTTTTATADATPIDADPIEPEPAQSTTVSSPTDPIDTDPIDADPIDADPIEPGSPPPTTVPKGEAPATDRIPTLVLVAVVGHDQVAELSTGSSEPAEGGSTDTAPVDGWSLLSVALFAPIGAETVTVPLRRIDEDGTETAEDLEVELNRGDLQLLTDRWHFDLEGVDSTCVPPDEKTSNEAPEQETDLFGSPIGDAPDLPPPGERPADPTASTVEALSSLRAVYDLSDIYAQSKVDFVENPEDWRVMLTKLAANDVVGPYMSQLDPVFRNSVFVSPTEVHVLYRVGPTYQWEIGRVLLIDGRWRVAAGTVCRDLAAANYTCPGVAIDPGPGPLG